MNYNRGIYFFSVFASIIFLFSCRITKHEEKTDKVADIEVRKVIALADKQITPVVKKNLSEMEQILIEAGLVKIKDYDASIKIDLKYASCNNFLNINLYGNIQEGYLQGPVVKQLVKAQQLLKDTFPQYSLIVFDAVRPLSIQQMMWDSIKVPVDQRSHFLSNPRYGSLHNYGAAVDVSIVDSDGNELDMGTKYDAFEPLAYPALEKQFLKNGMLTVQQVANRVLLRRVMNQSLFTGIPTEWWHFNACSNKEAKVFYALIKNHTLKKKTKVHLDNQVSVNIIYKVQLKISSEQIAADAPEFKGLQISFYKHKGLYKYVTGECNDIASVYELLDKVSKLGFQGAFVVAFNNNARIEIKDAIELMP